VRARSHTEFTAKISIVAEGADETAGWLEFSELTAIVSASAGTARYNERNRRNQRKSKAGG
jgi:hypothetical protein